MNLLITTPTFYPHAGGAESFLRDLARQFAGYGHRVTIATGVVSGAATEESIDGVQIRRIPYPPQTISLRNLPAILADSVCLIWKLFRMIRRRRIRVVCVGLVGRESIFVLMLTYVMKFRLIVLLHGSELRSYAKLSPLMGYVLKRLLKRCDFAVAVSQDLKSEAQAYQPAAKNKTVVIPCGIEIEKIREQPFYQASRKYILFAGRLHPVKGISTLIHAFQSVAADVPELDLLIAGTGPQEHSLKEMASELGLGERVKFLGARERSEVFSLIKSCEFLVLPAESEGCPLAVLETLAAGKVVVGSNVSGVRDMIQDGENGALFPAGDVGKLSELIFRFTRDETLRQTMERKIGVVELTGFRIQDVARKHAELYLGRVDRLQICLITASYYQDENCGGLSSYYFHLKRSLSRLGYKTHLITTKANGDLETDNTILVNTSWNDMSGGSNGRGSAPKRIWSRIAFSYSAYREVRKLDRAQELDIIVAPELFAQGFFASLFRNTKLITRIHTPTILADQYNRRHSLPWVSKMLSYPEKMQAKRSLAVTTASDQLAGVVSKLWSLSPYVLRNGIDVQWVRDLGINQKREVTGRYLLYFGRLERRKGVHILSSAMKEVLRAIPDIQMVWIGRDCEWKEQILREHPNERDRLIFYDSMKKDRLFPFIRHATLVILPSLFENFSNAGLEAMALERPLLATENTGFSEIIEDGINGFLVEPGNVTALGLKILDCLKRQDLQTIGKNAYATALQFESEKIAQQNVALFRKILES